MIDLTPTYEECVSIWVNVERYYKINKIENNFKQDEYVKIICRKMNIKKTKYYKTLASYYNKYKEIQL